MQTGVRSFHSWDTPSPAGENTHTTKCQVLSVKPNMQHLYGAFVKSQCLCNPAVYNVLKHYIYTLSSKANYKPAESMNFYSQSKPTFFWQMNMYISKNICLYILKTELKAKGC